MYCPRFIYFMKVLKIPQYENRRFKVEKGKEIHKKRKRENPNYLWKKIGAVDREQNVWLFSKKYYLSGIIDEIVTLEDDSLAPLDFKFTKFKGYNYRTHRKQMLCYCLLIDENYDKDVKKGYIYYIRDGYTQKKINYSQSKKEKIIQVVNNILNIIKEEKLPKKTTYEKRCRDCTYKNICS